MVAKKKPEVVVDSAELLQDETFNAESLNPALDALYAELGINDGGDATVHVSKIDSDSKLGEMSVWRGDPDDYDLEKIAKTFGSGQYRVKVYVRDQNGRKPCRGNKIFGWKLSPADERKVIEAANAPLEVEPARDNTEKMLAGLAAIMAENTRQMLEAMRPQNPLGNLDSIKQILEIVRPATVPQNNSVMETLNVATQLINLSKNLSPAQLTNADGEVSTNAILLRGLEVFGNAIAQAKGGAAPAQPGVPTQIIPGDPNAGAVEMPELTQDDEMNIMFSLYLRQGNEAAKSGKDPESVANAIWEFAPDNVINMLLNDPAWFQQICALNPECAQFQAWYEIVRNHIVRFSTEPDESNGDADLTKEKSGRTIDGDQTQSPSNASGTTTAIKSISTS